MNRAGCTTAALVTFSVRATILEAMRYNNMRHGTDIHHRLDGRAASPPDPMIIRACIRT